MNNSQENTLIRKDIFNGKLDRLRRLFISRTFMWLSVIPAVILICFGQNVIAAVLYAVLLSALLVICEDILATTLPFLTLCITVFQCYDSFDTFIKFIWIAPIPVGAILFHFIVYRRKAEIGKSFYGIAAISAALLLGGIGVIDIKEYFSGSALFYITALGIGMCGAYLLIKPQIKARKEYDVREKFVDIMYIAGCYTAFMMLLIVFKVLFIEKIGYDHFIDYIIIEDMDYLTPNARLLIQPGNNISTMLMMTMPFICYKAVVKNKLHFLTLALTVVCIALSRSRGGWVFGSVELLLCSFMNIYLAEKKTEKIAYGVVSGLFFAGAVAFVFRNISKIELQPDKDEARPGLIYRSFSDFLENPVFGQGIGSRKNIDLYAGKKGTLIWYHMWAPQVYGSMGAVGVLAYGYQLVNRIVLSLKKMSKYTATFAMSYVGLFLMSQVNPGEFCPYPYALIAVMMFIFIENEPDRTKITG